MEKFKRSLFGYSPSGVQNAMAKKDDLVLRQQQDIDFFRNENEHLKAKIETLEKENATYSRQNLDAQNAILSAPSLPQFVHANNQKNGTNSIQKANNDTPIFGM